MKTFENIERRTKNYEHRIGDGEKSETPCVCVASESRGLLGNDALSRWLQKRERRASTDARRGLSEFR